MRFCPTRRVSRPIAAECPAPARTSAITTSSRGGTLVTPTDKWSAKGDQMIGGKQRVSFFWNTTSFRNKPGPAGPPGLPIPLWNGQIQAWDTEAFRVAYDYTISATMVNHFSWFKNSFRKDSYSGATGQELERQSLYERRVDCNVNFPNIGMTEYTAWNSTTYNGTEQPGWAMKDDLSYIRGSHTMKFGFSFQAQNANGFGQQDISGPRRFQLSEHGRSRWNQSGARAATRSLPCCSAMRSSAARKRSAMSISTILITAFMRRTTGASPVS